MARKRLQNKIAENRMALPLTALYATLVWLANGLVAQQMYISFALMTVGTFLMMTLNNANSLIRTFSRMVSCSFLVLTAMAPYNHANTRAMAVTACLLAFYLTIFSCYQDKNAQGKVFYAFAFLGIASLWFIQVVMFVPFIWILTANNLMTFSHKIFWASLLGLVTPYWIALGILGYMGEPEWITSHIEDIATFGKPLDFSMMSLNQIIVTGFIALLTLTGMIHFMRNSYMDKIRTRMLYEFVMTLSAAAWLMLVLQPQHTPMLLGLLTVNTSILIAHFIALTRTKVTNIAFIVMATTAVAITAINLWMPSLTF